MGFQIGNGVGQRLAHSLKASIQQAANYRVGKHRTISLTKPFQVPP